MCSWNSNVESALLIFSKKFTLCERSIILKFGPLFSWLGNLFMTCNGWSSSSRFLSHLCRKELFFKVNDQHRFKTWFCLGKILMTPPPLQKKEEKSMLCTFRKKHVNFHLSINEPVTMPTCEITHGNNISFINYIGQLEEFSWIPSAISCTIAIFIHLLQ